MVMREQDKHFCGHSSPRSTWFEGLWEGCEVQLSEMNGYASFGIIFLE